MRLFAFVGCIATAGAPCAARADDTSSADVANARKHFEKARLHYSKGAYREAIVELEAARALDPSAKDLVFNLGVVHEKLANIDEALKWFRQYTTMDLTPQEHGRADAYVRRLEGAKKELEERQAAQRPSASDPMPPNPDFNSPQAPGLPPRLRPPEPSPSSPSARGRLDAWTVTAASTTTAAVVFGVAMAVMAEQERPSAHFVTPRDGTFEELQHRVDKAHRDAVLADLGFGAALASGIATAYLYFGRSRTAPAPTSATTVSAGPLAGGAAFLVKGSF
jgi:tetratricopeptide (TPR) repeat protein